MHKKVKVLLLKSPLVLLVVVSFLASIYLAIVGGYGVNFVTPIILGIILLLYIIGIVIENKKEF